MRLSPRAAAVVGYACGIVFFAADFSWFGETAGALLGPYGFVLDIGPAAIEATAFALAAAIAATAARRLRGAWVPLVAAAGFTLAELLRSSGLLGVPLYQIGAAFVDTPLAPLAAFGGVYLITFAVALGGAAPAVCAIAGQRRRSALRDLAAIALGGALVTGAARLAWPARSVGPASVPVAAIQGNIRQSVKWHPDALAVAVQRYTTLTERTRAFHPRLVVWPETVITTDLLLDRAIEANPQNAALSASSRALRARFSELARSLHTVIVVGTLEATATAPYNDLVFFGSGRSDVYRKRQLVPFAEFLPGPDWLRALPYAALVSSFGSGTQSGPFAIGDASAVAAADASERVVRVAPLICWEADFTDLAQQQAAAGATLFAIATDDAWFGGSDGPFAQAQLAQLRAIETGRWVVRAAATGISGIIAPDGRWRARSDLETIAVVTGEVGAAQPTIYSRLGPWPVGAAIALVLLAGFALGRRLEAR
jgi:apolipoprotein N-acyltransferase